MYLPRAASSPMLRGRPGAPDAGIWITRMLACSCASRSRRAPVPSVDPSSTKITSNSSRGIVCRNSERMQGSMYLPGSCAGMTTLIFGRMAGGIVLQVGLRALFARVFLDGGGIEGDGGQSGVRPAELLDDRDDSLGRAAVADGKRGIDPGLVGDVRGRPALDRLDDGSLGGREVHHDRAEAIAV